MKPATTKNLSTLLLSVIALAALLLSACSREASRQEAVQTNTDKGSYTAPPAKQVASRDSSLVRVIAAIPDTTADVMADNKAEFTGLKFKSVTPYKEVTSENHTLSIRPSGEESGPALAEQREGLGKGNHYTIVAMPGLDNKGVTMRVLNDNLTPPAKDKAKVRIINASPEMKEIDIYAINEKKALFTGVNMLKETGYSEINPMNTLLQVRPKGAKSGYAMQIPVNFEAGKIYTITIVGGSNKSPKLEAIVVEDQLTGNNATAG